ncbi:MAG: protocatechuate 3,4-dioxygenase [Neomegalonema sp.]|nr:protocatechuate 3,4-dioxygenase [Neomegalonema sp.]
MPNFADRTRRAVLSLIAGAGAAALTPFRSAAQVATPRQTEGPYYPTERMRFADQDNDLVKVARKVAEAGGEIFYLKGRVFDRSGKPAPGARVEIWQVDNKGRYLHTGDYGGAARDPHFQGFGFAIADDEGRYWFRTIKPVVYPGRTPHIHVKAFHGDQELTTQFYIDGHPLNERDGLWRRLSKAERDAVAMRFKSGAEGEEAVVDIRL